MQDQPQADDLFNQLAAEEPPITEDSTNPSNTKPRPAVSPNGAGKSGGGWMSLALVLVALVMLVAAGALFFGDTENEDSTTPTKVVENEQATATETRQPSQTPAPSETIEVDTPTPYDIENRVLPTAAADEELLALLTPVGTNPNSDGSVQRGNAPFTEQIGSAQNTFAMYSVQRNDTLDGIRKEFGLSDPCTLIWSNDRNNVSPLRPGAEILIPPVDGVYFKIREAMTIKKLAEATGVDPFAIIDSPYNADLFDANPDSLLVEGLKIMVPGGNGGNCNIWDAGPTVAGGSGSSGSGGVSGAYSLWGCSATVSGGGFPVTNPIGGRYNFFQGFSPSHTGVDLSADPGTPVLAAGGGTVVFAGWNNYGYGNTIVIAHGSTFTLYGHLSSIGVRCGQNVSGGQSIGGVGSTGRSSGPHLHFEIRDANFNAMDPVYTIGF